MAGLSKSYISSSEFIENGGSFQVLSFAIRADDKLIFNGTAIGRTLIVRLPANVTASRVELKVLNAKKTPSFRLFAVPDPASCFVRSGAGGCDLIMDTECATCALCFHCLSGEDSAFALCFCRLRGQDTAFPCGL